jgi:hypothetical protein
MLSNSQSKIAQNFARHLYASTHAYNTFFQISNSSLLLRPPVLRRSVVFRNFALVNEVRTLKELEHLVDQTVNMLA